MPSLPRPLDPIPSIKLKLAVLLVGSGVVGLLVFWHGVGSFPPKTSAAAIVIALVTSQVLAHGITASALFFAVGRVESDPSTEIASEPITLTVTPSAARASR